MIALKILAAWLLADFLTGVVHWIQDLFMDKPFKNSILNSIKEDNDLHHKLPTTVTTFTYWENLRNSVFFAWPLSFGLFVIGAPMILWLAVFFGSFANVIHRWAHTGERHLPFIIRWIQWTGLFASYSHHFKHHYQINPHGIGFERIRKEHAHVRFCVMTSWLNPILDRTQFFTWAEILVRIGIWFFSDDQIEGDGDE